MIKADCHLHTVHSGDSSTPMEQMIEQGIRLGLSRLCFTEHLDWDYPVPEKPGISTGNGPENPFSLDLPAYSKQLLELQAHYRNQIEIRFGIELGMIDSGYEVYRTLLEDYPFDFVIASSHLLDRLDPYYPEFWKAYEAEAKTASISEVRSANQEGIKRYFASTLEHLAAFDSFDTYAHLDYIIRYTPGKRSYAYSEYADLLDAVLKRLIEMDKALEVNTGGYKYGLGVPNPQPEVLRRYRELGGELITIGSDAHAPEHIAYSFKACQELLVSLGFRYYAVYDQRKRDMWKF